MSGKSEGTEGCWSKTRRVVEGRREGKQAAKEGCNANTIHDFAAASLQTPLLCESPALVTAKPRVRKPRVFINCHPSAPKTRCPAPKLVSADLSTVLLICTPAHSHTGGEGAQGTWGGGVGGQGGGTYEYSGFRFPNPAVCNLHHSLIQRFRKGVGGQRGLAQGNPSHIIDSGPFSAPFFLCPLVSRRTYLGENFWRI